MAKLKKVVTKTIAPQKAKTLPQKTGAGNGIQAKVVATTAEEQPDATSGPEVAAKSITGNAKLLLTSKALITASNAPTSRPADMNVTFTSGIGQITALLFRNGLMINMQSISSSSNIHFSDVQRGDAISVTGVCTGDATIKLNIDTDPMSPSQFSAQSIHIGYDIL